MEGIGILHDVAVWYDKTELALDFHIFEVQDFDILIEHCWRSISLIFAANTPPDFIKQRS